MEVLLFFMDRRETGFFKKASGSAFTVMEMLISVSVIGILAVLVLAGLHPALNALDNAKCLSNLHQIGVAVSLYTADNNGRLPGPLYAEQCPFYRANTDGVVLEGHLIGHLVPYLNEIIPPPGASNSRNSKVFLCPSWVKFRKKMGYVVDGATITGVPFQAATKYFGYFGSGSTPASNPQKIMQISNPSEERAFFETDAMDGTAYGKTKNVRLATEPVHKTSRNHLYFDGHASGVYIEP